MTIKTKPDIYRKSDNYVILDFETTNLDKGSATNPANQIILACWTVVRGQNAVHKHKFGSEFEMSELVHDVLAADYLLAQNVKFELQWLRRCGVNLRRVVPADTLLAEWVLNGNIKKPMNLGTLSANCGLSTKESVVDQLIKSGVCPSEIPKAWLLKYCKKDVELCWEIHKQQLPKLEANKLEHIYLTRCLVTAVLADISFNKMTLDPDRVRIAYDEAVAAKNKLEEELSHMAGDINLASHKQLAEFLYDKLKFQELTGYRGKLLRTPGGARLTDKETLEKLVARTPEQREFLTKYKELAKHEASITKSLLFYEQACRSHSGQYSASLNMARTATHRLSSSGVPITITLPDGSKQERGIQLQNQSRDFKRLYRASSSDKLIGEADSAQIEFRVAGDFANDPVAYYEVANEIDVHAFTRDTLNENGMKVDRTHAKPYTFKPLYGGRGGANEHPAVREYCEAFRDKYKAISKMQEHWTRVVLGNKKLRTPLGMVYYWPDCTVEGRGNYIKYTTQIYNFPVQGGATAEIVPIALLHFWYRTEGTEITLLMTVHDSIVSEFPPHERERWEHLSKQCMSTDVFEYLKTNYNYTFKFPLGVGTKVSTHWGDTKKETLYNVFPDGRETKRSKGE